MATILLVGVDLFVRGKLEALLPGHHFMSAAGVEPPDLVIADIARIDAEDVAEHYLDVPLLGYTNHTDTAGLRRAHAAGFDQVVVKSALFERPEERIGGLLPSGEGPAVTYVIAEPCIDIKDKSCIDVCPVDCIHEAARMLVIDPEECIDCGACEPECPVEAIFPEDALPEKWEPFVKINAVFNDGIAAV